jgi:hypothetical protein
VPTKWDHCKIVDDGLKHRSPIVCDLARKAQPHHVNQPKKRKNTQKFLFKISTEDMM